MPDGKIPTLAWTPEELSWLPPVYVTMIHHEHANDIDRFHASIAWAIAEQEKKDEKKAEGKNVDK